MGSRETLGGTVAGGPQAIGYIYIYIYTPRQARGLPLGVYNDVSCVILTRIPKGIPPHPGVFPSAYDPPQSDFFGVCCLRCNRERF